MSKAYCVNCFSDEYVVETNLLFWGLCRGTVKPMGGRLLFCNGIDNIIFLTIHNIIKL